MLLAVSPAAPPGYPAPTPTECLLCPRPEREREVEWRSVVKVVEYLYVAEMIGSPASLLKWLACASVVATMYIDRCNAAAVGGGEATTPPPSAPHHHFLPFPFPSPSPRRPPPIPHRPPPIPAALRLAS
ncbi:hypothetical protein KGM_203017 [Danaus plexippus plexippus]|uniref:Uncharacterized protein n=1 Tax=Danaus plexippus plexippus TaxID=278856 RepID=A0A212EKC3_DANPL|nr:hypothetical protein KGM_203017 [Danaus plexippus plexippus]